MTLDEAIKHAEEVADDHDRIKQIKAVTLEECRCAEEHRQLAEWLKELKQLREQTRWVPCSERSPVELESVLAYDGVDMFVAWRFGKEWSSSDSQLEEYTPILAWMPLPEPYKAESEET